MVAYATDADVVAAAFALAGRLFVAGLLSAAARELPVTGPVFDPRPDPTGPPRRLRQRLVAADRRARRRAVAASWPASPTIPTSPGARPSSSPPRRWAGRRGYWWSPDGEPSPWRGSTRRRCRAGGSPTRPSPATPPTEIAYPAAGTDNAIVTLHLLGLDGVAGRGGAGIAERFPYLADVLWAGRDALLRHACSRATSAGWRCSPSIPTSGATDGVFQDADEAWVELVPGTPGAPRRRAPGDGAPTATAPAACSSTARPVTDPELQVRGVAYAGGDAGDLHRQPASTSRPSMHVWRWTAAARSGVAHVRRRACTRAAVGGDTVVLRCGHPRRRRQPHRHPATAPRSPRSPRRRCVRPNVTLRRAR